jgi:hypothetical protein
MGNILLPVAIVSALIGVVWAHRRFAKGDRLGPAIAGGLLFFIGAGIMVFVPSLITGNIEIMLTDLFGGALFGFGSGNAVFVGLKELKVF